MGNHQGSTAGYFEPSTTIQLLPRCGSCSAPHPLARKPKADPRSCPDCGEPAGQPGRAVIEKSVLTGGWGGLATFLIWIGNKLRKLAGEI